MSQITKTVMEGTEALELLLYLGAFRNDPFLKFNLSYLLLARLILFI